MCSGGRAGASEQASTHWGSAQLPPAGPQTLQQCVTLPTPAPAPLPCPYPCRLCNHRYLDNMTSERVDAEGMAHVAAAAAKYMQRAERSVQDVLSMRSAEDLAKWQR